MLGLLFGSAVLAGSAYGARELQRYATTSPTFALARIEVQGGVRVTESRAIEASGLERGDNVFRLDLDAAAARLRAIPWVEAAQVERRLPDGVRIRLIEHEPLMFVALEQLYYVDRNGQPFRAYQAGEPLSLPVLTGLERARYLAGEPETMRRLRLGLELVLTWMEVVPDSPLPASIEVGPAGLSTVVHGGVEVVLGPPPWEQAIGRAMEALRVARAEGLAPHRMVIGREGRDGQEGRDGRVTVALEPARESAPARGGSEQR